MRRILMLALVALAMCLAVNASLMAAVHPCDQIAMTTEVFIGVQLSNSHSPPNVATTSTSVNMTENAITYGYGSTHDDLTAYMATNRSAYGAGYSPPNENTNWTLTGSTTTCLAHGRWKAPYLRSTRNVGPEPAMRTG